MKMTRKEFLRASAGAAGTALLGGCAPSANTSGDITNRPQGQMTPPSDCEALPLLDRYPKQHGRASPFRVRSLSGGSGRARSASRSKPACSRTTTPPTSSSIGTSPPGALRSTSTNSSGGSSSGRIQILLIIAGEQRCTMQHQGACLRSSK